MPEYIPEGPYEFAVHAEPAQDGIQSGAAIRLNEAFRQAYAAHINALINDNWWTGQSVFFNIKPKSPQFEYEMVDTNLP